MRGNLIIYSLFFYMLIFLGLARRGRSTAIEAAIIAGIAILAIIFCLEIWVRLPDMGLPTSRALSLRNWPQKERKVFLLLCLCVAACTAALCLAALFFL